jgi:hypothetical protein
MICNGALSQIVCSFFPKETRAAPTTTTTSLAALQQKIYSSSNNKRSNSSNTKRSTFPEVKATSDLLKLFFGQQLSFLLVKTESQYPKTGSCSAIFFNKVEEAAQLLCLGRRAKSLQ